MNCYTLQRARKHFCQFCLKTFSTFRKNILKIVLKTALKLMKNRELLCLEKVNLLNLKIMREKNKFNIHNLCRF